MKADLLDYVFPEELIACAPQTPARVMLVEGQQPRELKWDELLSLIPAGDVLVLNNTRVIPRRIFAETGEEILFLQEIAKQDAGKGGQMWQVLFPARKQAVGSIVNLPGEIAMQLKAKGRPQIVEVSQPLDEHYFEEHGELPLPPYIQKLREQRRNVASDQSWYQTAWAEKRGSFAAPTASLHFSSADIQQLKQRGVQIVQLTLHVGMGTFLPVQVEDLREHPMHSEDVEIPAETIRALGQAKSSGGKVWAMGTTVTRALEAWAHGHLQPQPAGGWGGETNLLLLPGSEFKVVDHLLTNFHQPRSTLLALVAAFSGLATVQDCYRWAIARGFRRFSYGDLSVWMRQ